MLYVTSSDLKTADAAIVAQECRLYAVTIIPAAAASNVILYDNASAASGTVLAKVSAVANGVSNTIVFNEPLQAGNGIYADVTGASAAYIVHYIL